MLVNKHKSRPSSFMSRKDLRWGYNNQMKISYWANITMWFYLITHIDGGVIGAVAIYDLG